MLQYKKMMEFYKLINNKLKRTMNINKISISLTYLCSANTITQKN